MRPAVLSVPQFRLLFAGDSVSAIGDALFPVALAFAVLDELDGTPGQLSVLGQPLEPLTVVGMAVTLVGGKPVAAPGRLKVIPPAEDKIPEIGEQAPKVQTDTLASAGGGYVVKIVE